MGPGRAIDAFVEARDKALVRYLGVTGHAPQAASMHLKSLAVFDFDAVMLSYNYAFMGSRRYASQFDELARVCQERRIALQTIKAVARQPWAGRPKTHNTCLHEPLVAQEAIDTVVHWVLGHPTAFLVAAGDMKILPGILEAAEGSEERPAEAEMASLAEKHDIQPIFTSRIRGSGWSSGRQGKFVRRGRSDEYDIRCRQ